MNVFLKIGLFPTPVIGRFLVNIFHDHTDLFYRTLTLKSNGIVDTCLTRCRQQSLQPTELERLANEKLNQG